MEQKQSLFTVIGCCITISVILPYQLLYLYTVRIECSNLNIGFESMKGFDSFEGFESNWKPYSGAGFGTCVGYGSGSGSYF